MGPREGFKILFDGKSQLSETRELRLNADKAKVQLGWSPIWNCRRSLEQTSKWYREFYEGFDSDALSAADLEVYLRELSALS
jgi:nucleoside-diphosphate-sugar epimerase